MKFRLLKADEWFGPTDNPVFFIETDDGNDCYFSAFRTKYWKFYIEVYET